jgi:hypothetical protein
VWQEKYGNKTTSVTVPASGAGTANVSFSAASGD